MEEQGLALQQAVAAQEQAPQQREGQISEEELMQLVQQIAELLQRGANPDELVKQGVPPEIIQMAMEMVNSPQQGGQGFSNAAESEETLNGLAATVART